MGLEVKGMAVGGDREIGFNDAVGAHSVDPENTLGPICRGRVQVEVGDHGTEVICEQVQQ